VQNLAPAREQEKVADPDVEDNDPAPIVCTTLLSAQIRSEYERLFSFAPVNIKLRLPNCEIRCEIYEVFRSLVCFILPFLMYETFRTESKIK